MKHRAIARAVVAHFRAARRDLPWRRTRDPYAIWISEAMLQQTRVAANDSLGLCIFGMSVTTPNTEFLTEAINAAHGTHLTKDFFEALGFTFKKNKPERAIGYVNWFWIDFAFVVMPVISTFSRSPFRFTMLNDWL